VTASPTDRQMIDDRAMGVGHLTERTIAAGARL
jgi:hypothetical protein